MPGRFALSTSIVHVNLNHIADIYLDTTESRREVCVIDKFDKINTEHACLNCAKHTKTQPTGQCSQEQDQEHENVVFYFINKH